MTQAAAALDVSAQAKRTVRLVSQSPALRQALRRAFAAEESTLSLRIDGEGRAQSGPVDVLILDLASDESELVAIAPVVLRLVPNKKWFTLSPLERQPGRAFLRPDEVDASTFNELAGSVIAALRVQRRRPRMGVQSAGSAPAPPLAEPAGAPRTPVTPKPTSAAPPPRTSAVQHPSSLSPASLSPASQSSAAPAPAVRAPAPKAPASPARVETDTAARVVATPARPGATADPVGRSAAAPSGLAGLGPEARQGRSPLPERGRTTPSSPPAAKAPLPARTAGHTTVPPPEVRRAGRFQPRILVVGSSTGGPQALMTMFRALPHPLGMPALIVQHMPPTFTPMLAEHINSATSWPCREAQDNEPITTNEARVAPGGYHLELADTPNGTRLKLHQGPPVNFCRPAVDVLFHSAARLYGRQTLAVILTGMGSDGAAGAEAIRAAGGMVFVQDEETSVVWGMPGAAARIGAADKILPLDHIARAIASVTKGVL